MRFMESITFLKEIVSSVDIMEVPIYYIHAISSTDEDGLEQVISGHDEIENFMSRVKQYGGSNVTALLDIRMIAIDVYNDVNSILNYMKVHRDEI